MEDSQLEQRIQEMYDALGAIAQDNPDREAAYEQAAGAERALRAAHVKDKRIRAEAYELLVAMTGDEEDPLLWRINWLATLLRRVSEPDIFRLLNPEDPEAAGTMLCECQQLVDQGNVVVKRALGEQEERSIFKLKQ